MKLLLIADHEENVLWDNWTAQIAEELSDVEFILSAGDLSPYYLEFLVTMLNVPLVYVRGNHDGQYDDRPPEGCIDADGSIIEVESFKRKSIGRDGSSTAGNKLRILGLGGSMRYKNYSKDMYTEKEMNSRIKSLWKTFLKDRLRGKEGFDILLTHAPCRGYGDMEDLPHRGFECFSDLLEKYHPKLHVYGHVHEEYGEFHRIIQHPSGTQLINASGHYIVEI